MSESTNSSIIEMPAEGPLELCFILYYKDGTYDHSRHGRRFIAVRLPEGGEHHEYSLDGGAVPGISFSTSSHRTSAKHQETRSVLTIEPCAPLPLSVLVDEIDEYHPDYYNQLDMSWEERTPSVVSAVLELKVVLGPGREGLSSLQNTATRPCSLSV